MHAPAVGQSGLEELAHHPTNLRMEPGTVMKPGLRENALFRPNTIHHAVLSMEFIIQDKYCYADKTIEDVHTPTTTLRT
jgi:hypothetical protein